MENQKLNVIGLQEMNAQEMRKTEGGLWPLAYYAVAWAITAGCCAITKGLYDGANAK